jgi:RimJ/RimL family protein N-acetyltransferase
LQLRPARCDDVVLFYNWVNDPEVRANSFSMTPISWATHTDWFARRVESTTCHLFVLEASGLPVGQVRFDLEDDEARVDYSLDEFARGRGWGTQLLARGLEAMRRHQPVRFSAHVKDGNFASRSVFKKLGFTLDQHSTDDHSVFCLDPKRLETRRPGAMPVK